MSSRQRGYTLVEVLAASASASVLVAGLASAMYIATQGLGADEGSTARRARSDLAATELLAEARRALWFTERTARTVEFKVADRTGDSQPETLRYEWSGTPGDPLVRSFNGASPLTVTRGVEWFELVTDERMIEAEDVTIPKNVSWPVVQSFGLGVQTGAETTVGVTRPAGTGSGDLLLAAIAIDRNHMDDVVPPTGFSPLEVNEEGGQVTLGVWWKVAGSAEPTDYSWSWSGGDRAVAWVVRITNQYPGNPVTSFATASGLSASPECPATGTTVDQSLVVRIGAFDGGDITPGAPGLTGHTPLLMEAAGTRLSGGCGWKVQRRASDCGSTAFALTSGEEHRTMTVVIAPAEDP